MAKSGMSHDWGKSSYSNGNGGNNCVESRLADAPDGTAIEVRDSKNPTGPTLRFTKAEWSAFIDGARDGEFDLNAKG